MSDERIRNDKAIVDTFKELLLVEEVYGEDSIAHARALGRWHGYQFRDNELWHRDRGTEPAPRRLIDGKVTG